MASPIWLWTGELSRETEEDRSLDPGGTGEGPAGVSGAGGDGVLRVFGDGSVTVRALAASWA